MQATLRAALALCLSAPLVAAAVDEAPLPGDYGGVGLWQTPTARFGDDGALAIGIVANSPYNRLYVSVMPAEWLEATFRYTDITDVLYSPDPEFSGDQSYKDRGFDVRVGLVEESDHLPALAIGLRDVGGTSLFGAQFLVASRRYYDLDFSLGLGWGRLGSGGPIDNPFSREADAGSPGDFSFSRLFSSDKIGIFGGVTWDAPIDGLQLVAEYEPNDYQNEPFDNTRDVKLPVNFGAKYRTKGGITTGLSYQRGGITSFQLGFALNLGAPSGVPKVLDPAPPMSRAQQQKIAAAKSEVEPAVAEPETLAKRVETALSAQRITMRGFALAADQKSVQIWIASGPYRDSQKLVGRTARAASAVLPDSVLTLRITEQTSGVETFDAVVMRAALERVVATEISLDEFQDAVKITAPVEGKPEPQYAPIKYPQFGWSLNPALRSSIGGPDSFYFGQLYLKLGGYVNLTPNWSADSVLGLNIYNNFDDLKLESNSNLPRVRSDIKNYLQEGEQSLIRLESNYIQQLAPEWFGRVSGGIFEEMYGGVAGEILYRPADPRFAIGLNVNRVRQRDFNQRLGFRDYEVTTGHLTGYFEFARPSVLVKLSVGQYLAGDRGGTVDISRQFPNGIRIGAFATKTDVSAAEFGEGRFDKGIYIILPLDSMLPRSTSGSGAFLLRPLTRDGGQMVRDGRSLYDITYGAVKSRMPLRDGLFFQ